MKIYPYQKLSKENCKVFIEHALKKEIDIVENNIIEISHSSKIDDFYLDNELCIISLNKSWNNNYENFIISYKDKSETIFENTYIPYQNSSCLIDKDNFIKITSPIANIVSIINLVFFK